MAVLFYNGFDWWPASSYDPSTTAGYESSATAGWVTSAGTLGGRKLGVSSGNRALVYNLGTTYATLVMGGRIRIQTNTSLRSMFEWLDAAGSTQVGLCVTAAGKLAIYRGTTSTIIATGTTSMVVGSEYFVEMKITFNNSGTYELKLDGASEIASGSADTTATANSSAQYLQWTIGTSSPIDALDDIYVSDTTGGAPYNDFLGVIRVETLFVTSNDSVQFTPLSSTNASNVDDSTVDDDSTYNSDTTSGHVDTFNHGSLGSTPTTIFDVAVMARMRKDDVTSRQGRTKLKSSGTTSSGSSTNLATVYVWLRTQYSQDPDTSAAWGSSAVNATKIGYEHV